MTPAERARQILGDAVVTPLQGGSCAITWQFDRDALEVWRQARTRPNVTVRWDKPTRRYLIPAKSVKPLMTWLTHTVGIAADTQIMRGLSAVANGQTVPPPRRVPLPPKPGRYDRASVTARWLLRTLRDRVNADGVAARVTTGKMAALDAALAADLGLDVALVTCARVDLARAGAIRVDWQQGSDARTLRVLDATTPVPWSDTDDAQIAARRTGPTGRDGRGPVRSARDEAHAREMEAAAAAQPERDQPGKVLDFAAFRARRTG